MNCLTMASLLINDLVEELSEENKRLLKELLFANKCLKHFIQFKTFIDSISPKFKHELNAIESQDYIEFNETTEKLIKDLSALDQSVTEEEEVPNHELEFIDLTQEKQDLSHVLTTCEKVFSEVNNDYEDNGLSPLSVTNDMTDLSTGQELVSTSKPNTFNSKAMKTHGKTKNVTPGSFICPMSKCNKTFMTKWQINRHMKVIHSEKKYVCDYPGCDYKTTLNYNLKTHYERYHEKSAKELSARDQSASRRFKCPRSGCQKSFRNKVGLRQHQKCHSVLMFICKQPDCRKRFKAIEYLKKHVTDRHSDNQYVCGYPGCDFKTPFKKYLPVHYTIHIDQRTLSCEWPQCDQRFKNKKHLQQHMKSHNEVAIDSQPVK